MAKGWSRRFPDPIALPEGGKLTTLKQAIAYLAKTVPRAEQSMPEVLTAAEILTYAAGARDRLGVSGAHRHAAGNPPQ